MAIALFKIFKKILINKCFVSQYQLEEIFAKWKTITLLSFSSSAKLLMNGFVSWHMLIKEMFDKTCIEDYNSIPKDQWHKHWILWLAIWSIFKFEYQNILCLQREKSDDYNLFLQDLNKDKIVKFFKCAMSSDKIKVNNKTCKYEKTYEKDIIILMNVWCM